MPEMHVEPEMQSAHRRTRFRAAGFVAVSLGWGPVRSLPGGALQPTVGLMVRWCSKGSSRQRRQE